MFYSVNCRHYAINYVNLWILYRFLDLSLFFSYLLSNAASNVTETKLFLRNSSACWSTSCCMSTWLEHSPWLAFWLTRHRSLVGKWSVVLLSDRTDREPWRRVGYPADIILSGVTTLMFSPLKLTADNKVFLARQLDSEPWPVSCLYQRHKIHVSHIHKFDIIFYYTWNCSKTNGNWNYLISQ